MGPSFDPNFSVEVVMRKFSCQPAVGCSAQRLIATVERSGLQTHIATTASISLCERMKN
jgi:hypothetical protein